MAETVPVDPEDVPLYDRVVTWDMAGIPNGYAQLSGFDSSEPGTVALRNLPLVALGFVFGGGETGGVGGADYLKQLSRSPEALIQGNVTGDPITSAEVMWPGEVSGIFTVLERDASGVMNSYSITYGVPTIRTYTQPPILRNANGGVTFVPAIVVSGEVEEQFPTFASKILGGDAISKPNNILSGGKANAVPAYIIRGGGAGPAGGYSFASSLSGGDSTSTPSTILSGGPSTSESQYLINGGGA